MSKGIFFSMLELFDKMKTKTAANVVLFFLENAGELRLIILRRMKGARTLSKMVPLNMKLGKYISD
jgi:hypothetical protein